MANRMSISSIVPSSIAAAFETPALATKMSCRRPTIARTCFASAAASSGIERFDAIYSEFDILPHLQFIE